MLKIFKKTLLPVITTFFWSLAFKVQAVALKNPLGTTTDPRIIIGNVINALLGIVGSIALVLFIYGGVQILISAGNADKVKKGRDTMLWAAIGLAIIFASYGITQFVIEAIGGA